ncbi:MAG TPA: cbb3-type cytochrome c oxidase subunit I [Solirubrobacteraceae bacterium]|nr:cbb3-type cytochrome c oxidase subunit I [Solirubrobacteraceae bacterium]
MSATMPTVRRPPTPRLIGLLTSTDHKHVGLLVFLASFAFFVLGGLLAMLMRAELAAPGMQVVSEDTYNQVFTIHGSTMFYLFGAPMVLGAGLYLVPLQIGASAIQWPRLALAGFWMLVTGGLIMYAGFFTTQGAGKAGWTAFDPLSDSSAQGGSGMDLWIIGVTLATVAAILWAACILATILRRRAPAMTMMRLPLFSWGQVAACLMTLAAFPALVLAMTLLYIDRNAGDVFTNPGGPVGYLHLFWFYGHPVVYVLFFPALLAAGEALAVSSNKRWWGYKFLVGSVLAFAALSMAVWGHHMFTMSTVANRYFALTTTAILVPAGIEYFDSLATMWRGRIVFRTSMLFALGFLGLFLIGGLSGIFIASPPLNYHVHDTYFIVGHFHYTLFGGVVMGMFAGIYHWFPKVTGRLLDERLGKAHFWLLFVGAAATFIPMFFLGHDGMVRRVANYPDKPAWQVLNIVASVGAYVILLGMAIFVVNVLRSLRVGRPAGNDPWMGHTLEWSTTSPPPPHNFDAVPPVRSYAPLMDLRESGELDDEGRFTARPRRTPEGTPS